MLRLIHKPSHIFLPTSAPLAQLHSLSVDFPILLKCHYCAVFIDFWYFLPIIHFITSLPFLSAVFYHTYYLFSFLFSEDRGKGRKKTVAEWKAAQSIQQISIIWYAWSSQSYRVINWHVAAGQLCIALVRCSQCNKMQ